MKFIADTNCRECPWCESELKFSRVRFWDVGATWLGFHPRRCKGCRRRYYVRGAHQA